MLANVARTDREKLEIKPNSQATFADSRVKNRARRATLIAFGIGITLLVSLSGACFRALVATEESDAWVRHSWAVMAKLQDASIDMLAIESDARGFISTGRESYLDSFRAARSRESEDQTSIANLTLDNPLQQGRLPDLARLGRAKIELAERIIDLRRSQGLDAAVEAVRVGPGQRLMTEFQAAIQQLQDDERRLLVQRSAAAGQRARQTKAVLVIGTLLGWLIVAAAAWTTQRDLALRSRAEQALLSSEEKYRMLVQGIQDHSIVLLDPNGKILSWNAGAERMTGAGPEQVIGRNFSRFFPADALAMDRPAAILRAAADSGLYEEYALRVRKDGTPFRVRSSYAALRDADRNIVGFSVVGRDLSESTESGAKYRGLLEAAPDAMVVVNQAGEIVLLNVQAEKQFGYHRDELVGQPVKGIIPEGFAERLIADGTRSAADALAQQIGMGIELIGRRKDSSVFPIEIMLSPLESAEGTLVTAAIRNISVRKAAEKHLAQMEGRYRGLLEAAPDAMLVVNQAGAIVLLNVQAENQFGYRRDELVGKPVKNIIPKGFAERLVADGLRSAEEALAQQIGTGIELVALRKDNTEFPIELMLSPLQSSDGILVTAAIRDISVRKAAETQLAQMEGRYRGLLEAAPDAMVVVNQAGTIVLLNVQAERQFGYRRDELLGQKVTSIIPEGFAERLLADALRSAEDASAQHIGTGIELIGHRKDGSVFPMELMLSPLESAEGMLVTAAIRDIKMRKDAEAHLLEKVNELYRSNEELGQFAYVASHDLQEPLRMVASYTQLLSRRYKGKLDADADEFIAFAVDGASRMQRLIQDLLTYSRVGTKGKELLDSSSEGALEQAVLNLRGAIAESGALVTHDPLPTVMADETQLVQLFQNLVGNAIKYQSPGVPRVHISAVKSCEKKWLFSVADNGLGIEGQYFERIFGMFQRLHKREEFAGTGIGLAICKKIVERHGGRISVESQVGQGSTFRFALAER